MKARLVRWAAASRRLFCVFACGVNIGAVSVLIAGDVSRGAQGARLLGAFLVVIADTLLAVWTVWVLCDPRPPHAAYRRARCRYRLTAAWRALCGHSVAYRVSAEGGGLTIDGDRALVAECMFIGLPGPAVTVGWPDGVELPDYPV